jgi:hypothetical protein
VQLGKPILLLRSIALAGDCHNADAGREHSSCVTCTRALFEHDGAISAYERRWRHILHFLSICTDRPDLALALYLCLEVLGLQA